MKLLYWTEDCDPLARELIARDEQEFTAGALERQVFPDGERYLRNMLHVKGANCTILGGTNTTENIFEILNLGYQLTTNGARTLNIVIPYFGYQTMERSSNTGEVIMAKNMAHWLSEIPSASYGNTITMLELHTDAIAHYFSPNVRAVPLSASSVIMKACVELAGTKFVLGSTDVGRAKAIEYIHRDFMAKNRGYDIETAFVYKRRDSGTDTEVTGINADVSGKVVVIYDDMIRTGGSLLKAAKIYRDAGATEVYAVTTHGVFPGNSAIDVKASGLIKCIAMTNSHPRAKMICDLYKDSGYYRLFSIGGLLSRYI